MVENASGCVNARDCDASLCQPAAALLHTTAQELQIIPAELMYSTGHHVWRVTAHVQDDGNRLH